jgi:putative hydrolase of the HAD superfamily
MSYAPPRQIQAVLFDLGDTLIYSPSAWPPYLQRAGQALVDALHASNVMVNPETFPVKFRQKLDEYYQERDRHLSETSTMTVLETLLAEKGFPGIPEHTRRDALDAYYAVTQTNWMLEPEAPQALGNLQSAGLRLGMISNAGDNRDVFQLVEKFRLEPYFDFILTSAACSYRKPHPRIFEIALSHWNLMPDQTAMIGDRLDADVGGSKLLGMYAIWAKRHAKGHPLGNTLPDAEIDSLSEIPPLLTYLTTL